MPPSGTRSASRHTARFWWTACWLSLSSAPWGLLLDMRTLQRHNQDGGLLGTLYRVCHMRVAVTFATTLLVVGIGIWQDVYLTGQTAQQRAQTASNTAQAVNSTIGSTKK